MNYGVGVLPTAIAVTTLDRRIAYFEKLSRSPNKRVQQLALLNLKQLRAQKALVDRAQSRVQQFLRPSKIGKGPPRKPSGVVRATSSRPAPPTTYAPGFMPPSSMAPSPNVDMTAMSLPAAAQLAPEMPAEAALTPVDATAEIDSASMWSNPLTWAVGAAVVGGVIYMARKQKKDKRNEA